MALQDAEAQMQIKQMRNFILNEARDKAQEIEAKALEDFNVEKLRLVQLMKNKIRQEYQQKAKQIETERAVARSVLINKFRLERIKARQVILDEIKSATQKQLQQLTENKEKYCQLCAELIAQAALYLLEDQLVIQCRKEDEKILQDALVTAAQLYSNTIKRETDVEKGISLTINKTDFLPPGLKKNNTAVYCTGGVKVGTVDGKAIIDNTLDARLDLVMEQCMPTVRSTLFSKSKA